MKKKKVQAKNDIKIPNVIFLVIFFLFALLAARGAQLALSKTIDGIDLNQFASKRTTKYETIPAKRAAIYDIHGDVLAQNVYSYTLIAYLSEKRGDGNYVADKDRTAEQLATVLSLSKEEILKLLGKDVYQTEFGIAGRGLTELAKDKIVALNLPGIDFIESQKRYYPKGDFLSYTLGYAKLNKDGKMIGEMGLEALYNDTLTGTDGSRIYQKDLRGYKIANTKEIVTEAEDGQSIYLTIDSNIQFFVEQALHNASEKYTFDEMDIVVADAKTGRILALSTTPSFDPNIKNIKNYLDPNISVAIEPGSTMKIFSYMAAMEAGKYDGSKTFKSGTFTTKDGTVIGDWDRKGWGEITYDKGFALSSNVGVVNLIDQEYIDRASLLAYYKKLGFGSKTGIELANEVSGKVSFKYETEVFNAGFGQGIMTTSLQNIKALTSLANDGILLQPYLVDRIVDAKGNIVKQNQRTELGRVASKTTTDKMKELMEQVVLNGTGTSYKMDGYDLIAKTGTAQIASTNGKGYLNGPRDVIRGFAGMFPKDDPEIIIYANLKRPSPNSPTPLANAVKEIIENTSKYLNIYQDEENSVKTSKKYTLPSFVSKDLAKVTNTLDTEGMTYVTVGNGTRVIGQYPEANTTISETEKIFLITEDKNILMPDLTGYSLKDAKTLMKLLNVAVTSNGSGYVVSQSIEKDTPVTEGLEISLSLQPKFEIPESG